MNDKIRDSLQSARVALSKATDKIEDAGIRENIIVAHKLCYNVLAKNPRPPYVEEVLLALKDQKEQLELIFKSLGTYRVKGDIECDLKTILTRMIEDATAAIKAAEESAARQESLSVAPEAPQAQEALAAEHDDAPVFDPTLQDEMYERIAAVLCAEAGEPAENRRGYLAAAMNVVYSIAEAKAEIGGIKFVTVKSPTNSYPTCRCFDAPAPVPDEGKPSKKFDVTKTDLYKQTYYGDEG